MGRNPETLIPLSEEGPYYAFEVKPTYTNTQGGPRRTKDACVLDTNGNPIPHLYSAGECGSIWGDVYQGAGNLGECFAFGLIAGANAAAEKDDILGADLVKDGVDFAVKEETVAAADNEYIGEGSGIGGTVRVKVTVEDGKVADIEILEQNETPDIGGVTGATTTTNAFLDALKDALEKAGL